MSFSKLAFGIFAIFSVIVGVAFVLSQPLVYQKEIAPFGTAFGEPIKKQLETAKWEIRETVERRATGYTTIALLSAIPEKNLSLSRSDIQQSTCDGSKIDPRLFEQVTRRFFLDTFSKAGGFVCIALDETPSLGVIKFSGYYSRDLYYTNEKCVTPESWGERRTGYFARSREKWNKIVDKVKADDLKNLREKYGPSALPFGNYSKRVITPSQKNISIYMNDSRRWAELRYTWHFWDSLGTSKGAIAEFGNCLLKSVNKKAAKARQSTNHSLKKAEEVIQKQKRQSELENY